MNPASSNRNIAAWKPLALVSAMATLSFPAIAQTTTEHSLAPVTVSGSRFASGPKSAPIGATVISAEQIREAGINNANEAIRKLGGIFGRQNLNGTSDYSLDLRGFGSASDQNVVIMVDGIRISENEGATALMSSIPVEAIERIEIVRGGSSVMYGEGATSGTIQIITKRGTAGKTSGSLVGVVGNREYREMRATLTKGWDNFYIDANVGSIKTDNYRNHNALRQDNFSGGLQWSYAHGSRIGVRVDAGRQDSELAGSIATLARFYQNPRQSNSIRNASIDSDRYTLFTENRVGNWEFATDLSKRFKRANSGNQGAVPTIYNGEVTQFSPRVRHVFSFGDLRNEVVFGVDAANSSRRQSVGSLTSRDGSQDSRAIYAKDEIQSGKARVSVGARREHFDQTMVGTRAYDQSFALNAADLQGSYEITPLVNVFAKAGRSYRVANIDENSGSTKSGKPIKPQTSNDFELGSSLGNDQKKLTVKFFRHDLTNEIYYDRSIPSDATSGFGANTNLDPTQREGIELEARANLTAEFFLVAVLQHVSAKFTEGKYAGREMTLVPKNNATMRLNWVSGNGQSADVGVQWVDQQRYGGDFSNTCTARIPAFTTVDARYAIRSGAWEYALSGTNLTGKDYFSQAFGTCANNSSSIYPDPGRAVKLSARYDF